MVLILFGISITDWIQAIVAIISLVTSTIAIIISIKSLKLTEKSISDANRPYVMMYIETIDTVYFSKDLVIKNFGKTSAKIEDIQFEGNLDKKMKSLIYGTIAPNQKFSTTLDFDNESDKEITVQIRYSDLNGKNYRESIDIKTDLTKDLVWNNRENPKDSNESTAIKTSTHAILRAFK